MGKKAVLSTTPQLAPMLVLLHLMHQMLERRKCTHVPDADVNGLQMIVIMKVILKDLMIRPVTRYTGLLRGYVILNVSISKMVGLWDHASGLPAQVAGQSPESLLVILLTMVG